MQFASSKACEALSLLDDDIHPIIGYSTEDFIVLLNYPKIHAVPKNRQFGISQKIIKNQSLSIQRRIFVL